MTPEQSTDSKTAERVMLRSGPLARELRVSAALLNYWAKQGHIPPPERDAVGVRVWDRDAVLAAVKTGWRGLRAGGHGWYSPPWPRGDAALPPTERELERDPLGAVIEHVVAHAADKAVKEWLSKLLERGEQANGVCAAAKK